MEGVFQELPQPVFRPGAGEAPEFHSFPEKNHGGKAAQPVMSGKLHVLAFVDLDLGQPHFSGKIVHHAFEHGRQGPAGRTPVRPEIDQNRMIMGCLQHVAIEIVKVRIENEFHA